MLLLLLLLRLFASLKMLYFDVESCRVTEANQLVVISNCDFTPEFPPTSRAPPKNRQQYYDVSHRIRVCYIYLHLPSKSFNIKPMQVNIYDHGSFGYTRLCLSGQRIMWPQLHLSLIHGLDMQDLLPFDCDACGKAYCAQHIKYLGTELESEMDIFRI